MYSNNPKHAQRSQEVIAQHASKIRVLLSDSTPKRFTQIMEETKLTRSAVTQALKAMEFSGEVRKYQAKDPTANDTNRVTWFELSRREV